MKFYYTKTSPFARKCLMLAIEVGIENQLQLVNLSQSGSFQLPEHFEKINPLYKIPALETADCGVIIDSPLICLYLNSLSKNRSLYSDNFKMRLYQLKLEAVADGLLDAAILRRYEALREPQLQSKDFDNKQFIKIKASLGFLENEVKNFKTPLCIGELAVLSSLAYLNFRFKHELWLSDFSKLSSWFKDAEKTSAFIQTHFE
jgi:glutathione S-transferase